MLIQRFGSFANFIDMTGISTFGVTLMKSMNYFGPILWLLVYLLLIGNIWIYFVCLLPIIYINHGVLSTYLLTIFALYLVVSVWFNHSMGMMIKPGKLSDYYFPNESRQEKLNRKEDVSHHKKTVVSGGDLKILMRYSHSSIKSVMDYKDKNWK